MDETSAWFSFEGYQHGDHALLASRCAASASKRCACEGVFGIAVTLTPMRKLMYTPMRKLTHYTNTCTRTHIHTHIPPPFTP